MANHIMSMPKNVGMSHLRASGVTATSSGLPTPPARSALQQFEIPTGSHPWLQKPLVDCSVAMCLSINRFLMQVGFFGTMLSPPSHRFLLSRIFLFIILFHSLYNSLGLLRTALGVRFRCHCDRSWCFARPQIVTRRTPSDNVAVMLSDSNSFRSIAY